MTPLTLSHRHTGTGDGSITTATYNMTQPSNHKTHHFLAITLNKEKLYTHNSNHNDFIFLITNLSIVPPIKERKAISVTGTDSENTTSVTAEVYYIDMSKWDQPLWAGWKGRRIS